LSDRAGGVVVHRSHRRHVHAAPSFPSALESGVRAWITPPAMPGNLEVDTGDCGKVCLNKLFRAIHLVRLLFHNPVSPAHRCSGGRMAA